MTAENDTAGNPSASAAQQDVVDTKTIIADDASADSGDNKDAAPAADPAKDAKPADDWRVKLAGGDEKELKRLARFASEADVYKAYRELEKKKDSGEFKRPFPTDGTPEEITQWRKDNGIPETHDKYDLTFESGLVIGDEDKPYIDKFLTEMHGKNASPEQVKAAIATYYDILGQQQQQQAEGDAAFKDESLEGLRSEWGGDFKKNLAAVNNMLGSIPEETRLAFETARTADGKLIGNDPAIIKWLAATAYELNPAAAVMPSATSNPGAAISDEIASIEKLVGDRSSTYWKGPEAEKMQQRYGELLAAREKMAMRQ
jgi:hypothetical protein